VERKREAGNFLSVRLELSVAAVCIGMYRGGRRFRVICSA